MGGGGDYDVRCHGHAQAATSTGRVSRLQHRRDGGALNTLRTFSSAHVWVHGGMGSWAPWICRCVSRCVGVWVRGCLGAWAHGCVCEHVGRVREWRETNQGHKREKKQVTSDAAPRSNGLSAMAKKNTSRPWHSGSLSLQNSAQAIIEAKKTGADGLHKRTDPAILKNLQT